MEDEGSWKQTMSDMLIQQLHSEKREEVMQLKISAITNAQNRLTWIFQNIHDKLNSNTTCEDIALLDSIPIDLTLAADITDEDTPHAPLLSPSPPQKVVVNISKEVIKENPDETTPNSRYLKHDDDGGDLDDGLLLIGRAVSMIPEA